MKRVSKKHPCAVCKSDHWCGYSEDGTKAVCMRVESERPTKNRGWLHILAESTDVCRPAPRTDSHSHPPAPPSRLHHLYSSLITDCLVLSDAHRSNLLARGLSESDIEANRYRTAPTRPEGEAVARRLADNDLRGVPGFYRERGRWQMFTPGPGFYVPVKDSRGRLRGFQIRMDAGQTRYLWFSSASKPEGQSSGAPVHFARPELMAGQGRVLITEGALKADVIAARLGVPVIGLPGVSTWPANFGQKLRRLFPALSQILLCFDSDFKTNPHVSRALFSLMAELRSALYSPSVLAWEGHKGFDDYLVRKAA